MSFLHECHANLSSASGCDPPPQRSNLLSLATRHPFLFLRQVPALALILEDDAAPSRDRPRPPPDGTPLEPAKASFGKGARPARVRVTFWGSAYHLQLWQTVLDAFMAVPPPVLQSFSVPGVPVLGRVLDLAVPYFKLAEAAKGKEGAQMMLDRVRGIFSANRMDSTELLKGFLARRIPGMRRTPGEIVQRAVAREAKASSAGLK
jgi:hypothetical protein